MTAEVSAERIAGLLSTGDLTPVGLLPGASNDTFLATVSDGELSTYAVYKPRRGEAPLWDFPDGTLYLREMAAFVVSRALGWDQVPPTVVRDGPLGIGMAQLFIEHDPAEHFLTLAPAHPDVFRRVAAFDLVINNADRKSGHCLLQLGSERIWIVDHGVAFHPSPKLRTVIWDYAGEPIPPALQADLSRFVGELDGGAGAGPLRPLLHEEELVAMRARLEALLRGGIYPEPGPGRPYPWPPI
ncbi:MAG: SCO1664 family protein [Chloroflexi bacterium]|nr:SCO1664 family protein [Chloroflexota bacterium]